MRIIIPPAVIWLANKAAKVPGVKWLLKPIYYRYKDQIIKNRNEQFHKHGIEVLRQFDQVMNDNEIPYTVFAGTMLGAVREHTFIAHDLDMDVAIFYDRRPDNIVDILRERGFKLVHKFSLDEESKGLEETYQKDDVTLDIFYVHFENDETYQCDFHQEDGCVTWEESMRKYGHVIARCLKLPVSRKLIRVPFDKIFVNVMENYDEWLRCRYGNDYMIPNPDFHDTGMNAYIIERWRDAVYNVFD